MSLNSTKLKGNTVNLLNKIPEEGKKAFDFTFVKTDLTESSLYDLEEDIKVIISVPSLDLGVCQAETRKFNEKLSEINGVIGIVVSKDLPFAMKRFCETEGIKNVITGSDYRYQDFAQEFNTEMIDGPMKGLLARAVFVVDKENTIRYTQLVPEVSQEPDYEKVIEAVKSLL
jgi:thiol peroxidase